MLRIFYKFGRSAKNHIKPLVCQTEKPQILDVNLSGRHPCLYSEFHYFKIQLDKCQFPKKRPTKVLMTGIRL